MRFPGFSGEWEEHTIGHYIKIQGGYAFKSEAFRDNGIPIIRISNLPQNSNTVDLSDCVYYDDGPYTNYIVKDGDLLIAMSGATTGKIAIYRSLRKAFLNQRVGCFRSIGNIYYPILYALVQSPAFQSQLGKKLIAGAQPNISSSDIETIRVNLPSSNEQEKIASFLNIIDQRIAIQSKIIEQYQSLIRALIQKAQSVSTKRVQLRDVLTERKELNSQDYDICSVSVSRGIVNQVEYLGRSFAAKETSNYHVVHFGDIVYTKSPTGDFPYGIIKQSNIKSPVAVSPLYGVYEPETIEIGKYLHYYFCSPGNALNYLHPLIQKGAKNTINITNQHFLDNTVPFPDEKILGTTVAAITSLAYRCNLEEDALCCYIKQKEYLLKNLFM